MAKIGLHGNIYKMNMGYKATVVIDQPHMFSGKTGYVLYDQHGYLQTQVVSEVPGWCYLIQLANGMYHDYHKRTTDAEWYMQRLVSGCKLTAIMLSESGNTTESNIMFYVYDIVDQTLYTNMPTVLMGQVFKQIQNWAYDNMADELVDVNRVYSSTMKILCRMVDNFINKIVYDGEDIGKVDMEWRKHIKLEPLDFELKILKEMEGATC